MQTLTLFETLQKKFVGTDELRKGLTEILDRLPNEGGEIVITQHGKPQAVLLDLDSYLDLYETLEDLQTPGFIESIHKGAREIEQGKGLTTVQLKKNLGL